MVHLTSTLIVAALAVAPWTALALPIQTNSRLGTVNVPRSVANEPTFSTRQPNEALTQPPAQRREENVRARIEARERLPNVLNAGSQTNRPVRRELRARDLEPLQARAVADLLRRYDYLAAREQLSTQRKPSRSPAQTGTVGASSSSQADKASQGDKASQVDKANQGGKTATGAPGGGPPDGPGGSNTEQASDSDDELGDEEPLSESGSNNEPGSGSDDEPLFESGSDYDPSESDSDSVSSHKSGY